ncbi:MAG TPA: site-2 protease family protein, partial [Thermomicrobiales bacterium]|nr:site-2 protease family protein [Thermomicrobiales bacterium]
MPQISDGLALGLLIIPILAFLILAHEFGHFFAARSVGVKVEEFGIGIPPRAKGWRRKGVLWSINWIPFGGFVRVKGEDGRDMSEGSMNTRGPAQRAFFLAAGSAMNFLVAIVLSIFLVAFQGVPDNTEHVYIADVATGSPAESAGWLPGDSIYAVDGTVVNTAGQLQGLVTDQAGTEIQVDIRRGDEIISTSLIPRENPPDRQGATGIRIVEGQLSILKVTDVEPGSVAAAAGWQEGDRIVAIDGIPLEAEAQARNLLTASVGREIPVTIDRDGETIETLVTVPPATVTLTQVAADSAASDALLYPGDVVVSVDGQAVLDGVSFVDMLEGAAGTTVPLEVEREGRTLTIDLAVPDLGDAPNALAVIGANARDESPYEALGIDGIIGRVYSDVPISQAIPEGWNQFSEITSGTFGGLRDMVTEGVDPDTLVGPVGMGQMTSELLTQSATPPIVTLTMITIVISVALGVLNLMPLPALDGGRLLFVLIEVLRGGKRISPEKEGLVHLAG